MDVDDRVPLVFLHVEGHLVPEDPGVVDQDVEVPIGVDGLVDHLLGSVPVRHARAIGHGLAAGGGDLGHDVLDAVPEVVEDQACPLGGEELGVGGAQPLSGAGDDGDLPVERSHVCVLLWLVSGR